MMADDQEQPKTRMGFLPKLVLWSLVLLFGFLYLGTLEREPGDLMPLAMRDGGSSKPEASPAAPDQPQATSSDSGPVALTAPDAESAVAPAAEEATPVAEVATPVAEVATPVAEIATPTVEPEATLAKPAAPEPMPESDVSKEEAEAFAQALMTNTAEPTGAAPAPPTGPSPKAAVSAAQVASSAGQASEATALEPTAELGEDTGPQSGAMDSAATTDAAASGAAPAPVAGPPARGGSTTDWVARHRAERDAYYAERRRQAEAFARQRWQAMQRMAPAGPAMLPPPSGYTPYGRWPTPPAMRYPSVPAAQ